MKSVNFRSELLSNRQPNVNLYRKRKLQSLNFEAKSSKELEKDKIERRRPKK
jgi:hypothetical protein